MKLDQRSSFIICLALMIWSLTLNIMMASDEFSEIEKKAIAGEMSAQFQLGMLYNNGKDAPQNYTEAF